MATALAVGYLLAIVQVVAGSEAAAAIAIPAQEITPSKLQFVQVSAFAQQWLLALQNAELLC
jgi:hypothetical protein